jgi:hypothetical protein
MECEQIGLFSKVRLPDGFGSSSIWKGALKMRKSTSMFIVVPTGENSKSKRCGNLE